MPATYEPIASVSSTSTDITISNIPGTYTDLVLVVSHRNSANGFNANFRVNGDSSTSYSSTYIYGDGSTAASGRNVNSNLFASTSSTSQHFTIMQFMSYSNTNVFKTMLDATGSGGGLITRQVGLWRNTAAITSINMFVGSAWATGGVTLSLYGIKAA